MQRNIPLILLLTFLNISKAVYAVSGTEKRFFEGTQKKEKNFITYKASLEFLGKTNSMTKGFGGDISIKGRLDIPSRYNHVHSISIMYKHEDFSFKTFNFMDKEVKEGKARLFQRIDKFSFKLNRLKDFKGSLKSRFTLDFSYLLAEDYGDSYISLGISKRIDYRYNKKWEFVLMGCALSKDYPDYYVSGRKLDHVLLELAPYLSRRINKAFSIHFGYSFYLKQYLDSKYYYKSMDESGQWNYLHSQEDKRYLTHKLLIRLEGRKKGIFSNSLEYSFDMNRTYNYDNKISGKDPKRDKEVRFIEGYYDFIEHSIKTDAELLWPKGFKMDLGALIKVRNFSSYPARDSEKMFIGEVRKDFALQLDVSSRYLISSHKQNNLADLFGKIQISYDYQWSNMKYEKSCKTNYEFFTFYAGMILEFP